MKHLTTFLFVTIVIVSQAHSKRRGKCPCVKQDKSAEFDEMVGFYYITMLNDGYAYNCAFTHIRTTYDILHVPDLNATLAPGEETGTQAFYWLEQFNNDTIKFYRGMSYRLTKSQYFMTFDDTFGELSSVVLYDGHPTKGFALLHKCLVTLGHHELVLLTRQARPDSEVGKIAKREADRMKISLYSVMIDKAKCDFRKKIQLMQFK